MVGIKTFEQFKLGIIEKHSYQYYVDNFGKLYTALTNISEGKPVDIFIPKDLSEEKLDIYILYLESITPEELYNHIGYIIDNTDNIDLSNEKIIKLLSPYKEDIEKFI